MQDSHATEGAGAVRRKRPLVSPSAQAATLPPLWTRRRPALSALRIGAVAFWTLPSVVVQTVLLRLPGGASRLGIARPYWAGVCRLIGLRVRLLGAPPATGGGRPVVFVANHSSWLDIPVLGAVLPACFVAKEEVAGWPIVGLLAHLGRTVFVSRNRASTGREREEMRRRLEGGDSLILFPEGTSSDGARVLGFHSSFLAIAEASPGTRPPLVQPISVVFDRVGFLPVGRVSRPLFSWYGDMELGPHAWRLGMVRGMRASVLLHDPLDPAAFASRKELSQAAWSVVADGAASLRQNREPVAKPTLDSGGAAAPTSTGTTQG